MAEIEPRPRQLATLLGDAATVLGADEAMQDKKDGEDEVDEIGGQELCGATGDGVVCG